MTEERPPGSLAGAARMEHGAPGESAPADKPRTKRARLGVIAAGVTLVALVAAFGGVALARTGILGGGVPRGWRAYHDPLGLFTISVPPTWTARVDMSQYGFGDAQGSASGQEEDILFSDPAQGGSSANVWILADQLTSDFARQWYCQDTPASRTSLNGYPADGVAGGPEWLLQSEDAHFQINEEIPGVIGSRGDLDNARQSDLPTPTSLPSSLISADRATLSDVMSSFKPATGPLACK